MVLDYRGSCFWLWSPRGAQGRRARGSCSEHSAARRKMGGECWLLVNVEPNAESRTFLVWKQVPGCAHASRSSVRLAGVPREAGRLWTGCARPSVHAGCPAESAASNLTPGLCAPPTAHAWRVHGVHMRVCPMFCVIPWDIAWCLSSILAGAGRGAVRWPHRGSSLRTSGKPFTILSPQNR